MSLNQFRSRPRTALLVALIAALGAGAAWEIRGAIGDEPAKKEVNPAAVRQAQDLSEAFSNAADVVMPSVVTVKSRSKAVAKRTRGNGNGELPKGLEDFFGGRGLEDLLPQDNSPRQGMGSGVIIDSSGLILTNNHVVDGADEVVIRLSDGREFKGEDIKTDEHTDLAIVRIKGAGSLPAAKLGNSDKLRIGDWVIAIGNPFDLDHTVSAGIISGLGRELGSVRRARFLQTDAAINPGNSGGPLVNLYGEVVGINTAIATNNGSFQGIGFAIPANLAKWVTGQLIKDGTVQRAYLGVGLTDMSADVAGELGAQRGEGVLVGQVFPNTPAAEAGLEPGDVILKFGGQKVKDRSELQSLVERAPLTTKQDIEVLRDGKNVTLSVTAKAMPKDFGSVERGRRNERGPVNESARYENSELGVEVSNLTSEQAQQLGIKADQGVLVTDVDGDGPGARHLQKGMVIMKVKKQPVHNIDEFKAALKGESVKKGILLHVHSPNGSESFVVVKE